MGIEEIKETYWDWEWSWLGDLGVEKGGQGGRTSTVIRGGTTC